MLKVGSSSTIGLEDKLASAADAAVHERSRACTQAAIRYFQRRDTQLSRSGEMARVTDRTPSSSRLPSMPCAHMLSDAVCAPRMRVLSEVLWNRMYGVFVTASIVFRWTNDMFS